MEYHGNDLLGQGVFLRAARKYLEAGFELPTYSSRLNFLLRPVSGLASEVTRDAL